MRLKTKTDMNVEKLVIDAVNAQIKINLVKDDYLKNVEKTLKSYRQKANVPGFRPGMVPMALIKKMYGKAVTADEVNKLLSETLYNYIQENKLHILGEPLPAADQTPQDLDVQETLEFLFDVALAPELNYTLDKNDVLPYYTITVTDEMVNAQVKSYAARGGRYEKVEVAESGDSIKGNLTEICEGEEGISVEGALVLPNYFKNDDQKAKFAGVKVGDVVCYNPYQSNNGDEADLASLLRLPKEQAKDVQSDFNFEVTEINRFIESDVNQDLFDQVYGKDTIKTEEEFRARIKEDITAQFAPESDYRFMVDAEKILCAKFEGVTFPVEFLKRWMLATDSKKTAESLDEEMPKMIEELKWYLLKEDIIKQHAIEVGEADVLEAAKRATRAQFAQFGMSNVPDDLLNNYANEMLKKPETARNLGDQALSQKVAEFIKGAVSLETKEVSTEEFNKLYEQ